MKYICVEEDDQICGIGRTLEEAYENLYNFQGDCKIEDCTFFEAEPIDVETKIIKKETPIKVQGMKNAR